PRIPFSTSHIGAVCRKTLQDVNRDSRAKPAPQNSVKNYMSAKIPGRDDSELCVMRPNLSFRSIKLKKLYRCAVVHDERNRDALGRAIGLNEYLLSGNRRLNIIHHKGHMGNSLDEFRQGTVRVKLHPLHAVRTLEIP